VPFASRWDEHAHGSSLTLRSRTGTGCVSDTSSVANPDRGFTTMMRRNLELCSNVARSNESSESSWPAAPWAAKRGVKVESVLGEKTDRIDDPKFQSAGAAHR
jgi:hypothetical protein